jgi:hypothetical protein
MENALPMAAGKARGSADRERGEDRRLKEQGGPICTVICAACGKTEEHSEEKCAEIRDCATGDLPKCELWVGSTSHEADDAQTDQGEDDEEVATRDLLCREARTYAAKSKTCEKTNEHYGQQVIDAIEQ